MMSLRLSLKFAVCIILSLSVAPSFAAGPKRVLDLAPCEPQFEAYRQASLSSKQENLAKEQSSAKPRASRIEDLVESIAAAQNMSGADFYGSGGGSMRPTHMHSFLQELPLAEARRRRKQDIAMLAALKAGDLDRYEELKGSRPDSPIKTTYLHAMSEADLCAWEARVSQLTGKAPLSVSSNGSAVEKVSYGKVVEKSTLGKCVSLVNPKRVTKIDKFDTEKGHSETRNDALNLTLKNSCNSDQIVGLIIKYKTIPLNTGGFAHLQLPESPYFDINTERQTLASVVGYAQAPFAGTVSNPYAYRFVPEQPISQYLSGQLLPAGAESKGMFVVPHGEVLDVSDPRTQILEYYVASCAAKNGDAQQGMFWDPARRYLACPSWIPVKVIR